MLYVIPFVAVVLKHAQRACILCILSRFVFFFISSAIAFIRTHALARRNEMERESDEELGCARCTHLTAECITLFYTYSLEF